MHVESVHLHGFGRLSGREFRFAPGLTIVHGPNEAGKSTLHAALSAALFGLTGSGRRKRDDAARIERFRPWDGGRYAATADIVSGGRIEMGIGGGWYENEWRAYGYGFPSAGERLRRLD